MTPDHPAGGAGDPIEEARAAARAYLREHGFTSAQVASVDDPPVLGPVPVTGDDGSQVTAYRWLGGGRGGDHVQVEVGPREVVVRGSRGDAGLPPATSPRG